VDDAHDGSYAREPQVEDLARICRSLNEAGARYLLIGGFAVIARDIPSSANYSPFTHADARRSAQIAHPRRLSDHS
jgi:hypothetical protein